MKKICLALFVSCFVFAFTLSQSANAATELKHWPAPVKEQLNKDKKNLIYSKNVSMKEYDQKIARSQSW